MVFPALQIMRRAFECAVKAVEAEVCLPAHLPDPPAGRTLVVAAGKAAAAMARVAEGQWPVDAPLSGLAVTRYGHGVPTSLIEVIEAGHPLPDDAGQGAGRRALIEAEALGLDDMLLCLLSGGGSALMAVPAEGISLADKQAATSALLRSGASISEINCVRKHLSAIKGGRLALAAWPARVVTLIISDVAGNDPAVIASGPTVPDPTTAEDARAILKKYSIDAPPLVRARLKAAPGETPKAGSRAFEHATVSVAATADDALAAATDLVRRAGYEPIVLDGNLEGDAEHVAREHAALALDMAGTGQKRAIMSGGEMTVALSRPGRGGPNQAYLLALALALEGRPGIWALACDTDGIDGSEENAGAWIGPGTLAHARDKGLDAEAFLRENNSYEYFREIGNLIVTGPTRTNVNDFRIVLVNTDDGPQTSGTERVQAQ
jgi:hydroxypyruvate reductase